MSIEIRMPRLVDSMTQGSVVAWRKREGEPVQAGEVIAEIEADKATVDLESPEDGILARIIVAAGAEKTAVGQVLAILAPAGQAVANPILESARVPPLLLDRENGAAVQSPANVPLAALKQASIAAASWAEINANPLAKSMAQQAGLDVLSVRGNGPGGRITRLDVMKALGFPSSVEHAKSPGAAGKAVEEPEPAEAPFKDLPHSRIRQVVAQRLSESKRSIPHFYIDVQCRTDALLKVRAEIQARRDGGLKLSINDFALRAVALALRSVPEANASWTEQAVRHHGCIDLAMAVATEAGLMAPVIRSANRKGLAELASEARDLSLRARAGRLRLEELQGGTFTLSNLGMYGVDSIHAIINPPQAAILGLGAAVERPIAQDGRVIVATVMTCTLSADHRVLDGAVGARFLSAFKNFIEHPLTMIL